jgi:excisionase family DNA binding protein
MTKILDKNSNNPFLNKKESALARTAQQSIIAALNHSGSDKLALLSKNQVVITDETPILKLPPKILQLIADTLGAIAEGQRFLLIPQSRELTTAEAASLLNVSRPFLTKLLKEGRIPFSIVGSHRRVNSDDLLNYKEKMKEIQNKAMQDLINQSQELGLD